MYNNRNIIHIKRAFNVVVDYQRREMNCKMHVRATNKFQLSKELS